MSYDDTLEIYRSGCNNPLCRIRISEALSSIRGELDVFIQSARGKSFERITVQRPDRFIDYPPHLGKINSCTWHGNYLKIDGKIAEPKIHLKRDNKKMARILLDGVIEQKNVFMFPVFSLCIPLELSTQNLKRKPKGTAQRLVLDKNDVRIDFYLLPKNITLEIFLQLSISVFYFNMDITMFNRQLNGVLQLLDNCELKYNYYKLKSWYTFIRSVYPKVGKVREYWIYFHDTLNPIDCILDRGYAFPVTDCSVADKGLEFQGKMSLRERHEKELIELGLKKTS